jgi:archaellum biogenesis ATPase FlaH
MSQHSEDKHKWKNLPRFDPSDAPETKWLWEKFIPERSIVFLVGDAGTYKSTFLLALCNAISRGKPFLGRATRQRRVLYLDNENGPDVLAGRNKDMNLQLESNARFVLWSVYGKVPLPKIGSHELRKIVRASVKEKERMLIVCDHWATFLKSGDGGETTGQTTPILQEMKRLCAIGATIVVAAHTVKYDKTNFYGGADIRAKVDAMHTFLTEKSSRGQTIHVDSFLKRHGGRRHFSIQPVIEKKDGHRRVTGFRVVKSRKQEQQVRIEKMCRLITKHPEASQRKLATLMKQFGIGRNNSERLLNKFAGKYWDVRVGENGKKTYVLRKNHEG